MNEQKIMTAEIQKRIFFLEGRDATQRCLQIASKMRDFFPVIDNEALLTTFRHLHLQWHIAILWVEVLLMML